MPVLYLMGILVSWGCMALVDVRYGLYLGRGALRRRSLELLGLWAVFFSADCVGIAWGIFNKGASPYMSGAVLFPHMPLEEILFLAFFAHVTCIAVSWTGRLVRPAALKTGGDDA